VAERVGYSPWPFQHPTNVFSNMRGNRMNIGHLYDLAYFNCLYCLIRLGPHSERNRHQRHQVRQWTYSRSPALS